MRVVAIFLLAVAAGLFGLAGPGAAAQEGEEPTQPTILPTTTTTEPPPTTEAPTTTAAETTTTFFADDSFSDDDATTDPSEDEVDETTNTPLDDQLPSSIPLLVPGPPAELGSGQPADSTTTTLVSEPTASTKDNTATVVALIISALLVVALSLSLLTYRYWRNTRPARRPAPAVPLKPPRRGRPASGTRRALAHAHKNRPAARRPASRAAR